MTPRSFRIPDYLDHIVKAIDRIEKYTKDISKLDFLTNELIQDAVVRNFEIIGEAAHSIEIDDPDFASRFPELSIRKVYGMRNKLIHGCITVDMEIVWATVQDALPELRTIVRGLQEKIKNPA